MEDIFISTKNSSPADVKCWKEAVTWELYRHQYLHNKLFSRLKITAYLGFEQDVNAKATLTEQDVQFA